MLELEKTFLIKFLPDGLFQNKSKEIIDLYIPKNTLHSKLRIRKNGDKYEMTKKTPQNNDPSIQFEHTIPLTIEEYNELMKLDGKKIHKIRYYYNYNNLIAEFDIFKGNLEGLALVDFEFNNKRAKNTFKIPDFCLADITNEDFIAGGILCGKKYENIEKLLKKYNYTKIN